MASAAATALSEFLTSLPIDPKLDKDCQSQDKDEVTVLGQFGKRTASGLYCEQDGFRVPIGYELNRDKKITKLCRDERLRDCLLERHGKQWLPVHRPRLDGTCRMTDSDGTVLGQLGEPSADGALPPAHEPRGLLPGRAAPVQPPEPGRFIVDPKGNVLIEPKGGMTVGNAKGTFTTTRYPNGSPAFEVHEAHPHTKATEAHGHWKAPGTGPKKEQWGPSLDPSGRPVPVDSAEAHWKVKK